MPDSTAGRSLSGMRKGLSPIAWAGSNANPVSNRPANHRDHERCPGSDGRNCRIWAPSWLLIHDKRRKLVPTLGFHACKAKVRFAISR